MVTEQPRVAGKFAPKPSAAPAIIGAESPAIVGAEPPSDNSGNDGAIDPARISERADGERKSESGKRGRGRPAGSGKEKTQKEKVHIDPGKIDLNSLNFTLFYAHSLLAKATKCPELALDDDECKAMSEAAHNVMKHYNIKASQKAIDWGNLLMTAGLIYGGRIHKISARQKEEKQNRKKAANDVNSSFGLSGHG